MQRRIQEALRTHDWVYVADLLEPGEGRAAYASLVRAAHTLPPSVGEVHCWLCGRKRLAVARPGVDPDRSAAKPAEFEPGTTQVWRGGKWVSVDKVAE